MSVVAPPTAPTGQSAKDGAAAAARQLEAYFLRQVLSTMPESALMGGGGVGGSTLQGMFNDVLADAVSAGGEIGLAKQIEESMQQADLGRPVNTDSKHDPTSVVDEITSRRAREVTGLTSLNENGAGE